MDCLSIAFLHFLPTWGQDVEIDAGLHQMKSLLPFTFLLNQHLFKRWLSSY